MVFQGTRFGDNGVSKDASPPSDLHRPVRFLRFLRRFSEFPFLNASNRFRVTEEALPLAAPLHPFTRANAPALLVRAPKAQRASRRLRTAQRRRVLRRGVRQLYYLAAPSRAPRFDDETCGGGAPQLNTETVF
jgi:hypothetical protein